MPRAQRSTGTTPAAERATKRLTEPLAYRVEGAAAAIGVSRSKVWELVATGDIPARKLAGATVVLRSDLEAYLSGLPAARPPST